MPDIKEIMQQRESKKFVKKNYRPWDLTGDGIKAHSAGQKINNNLLLKNIHTNDEITEKQNAEIQSIEKKEYNNQITGRGQLDNTLDNNQITNREQLGNVLDNNRITRRGQLDNTLDNNQITNREQLDNENNIEGGTLIKENLIKLTGTQQKIMNFLLRLCCKENNYETGRLSTKDMSAFLGISYGSIKMSFNRLINKGLIIRKKGRQAKGGYVNFKIPNELEALLLKPGQGFQNYQETYLSSIFLKKSDNFSDNKLDNNFLYSSSNNITTTKSSTLLPKAWGQIDIAPLEEIGFSTTQLKQLYQQSLKNPDISPESVQESIRHFAFGLEQKDGKSKYSQPLNVLMGVLRKGQTWIESAYQSPQEIAQSRLLEQKRLARERMKKMAEEAFNLAFDTWQDTLSKSQIDELTKKQGREDITPAKAKLQSHFRENIWPGVKHEYLIENEE